MARRVKCPTCDKLNDKKDTVQLSDKRYYCIECAEQREIQKARNKNDWDELFEYICDIYNIDTLTGMMFKQIKEFREVYNYTNKGIYLTLKYYYETLENEVKEGVGLGIVVYYYEKAKNHFIEKMRVKKHLDNFEINEQVNTVKIKKINIDNPLYKKQLSFDNVNWEQGEMNDKF